MPYSELPKRTLFWKLFSSTFILSAFTLGGGYVIVPLMRKTFVEKLQWIKEEEMLDLIAIGQSAPGPIAVNTSILVGYKIAHIAGAIVSLMGTVLPPLIILTVISYVYSAIQNNPIFQMLFFGMGVGVAAVILDAVVTLATTVIKNRKVIPILLMVGAFIAAALFKVDVIIVLLVSAIIGVLTLIKRPLK
ncbi:MAG: chromate transporter [Sphaerochaetaceae bacterium]|jgi:chromate transporter